jgi:hypothetical protein
MRSYLLELRERDGSVISEVLYLRGDDAGLVAPDGATLSTTETFAMYGRSWWIVDVHVQRNRVHITCVDASETGPEELAQSQSASVRSVT